jgi:hypothetical protein
VLFFYFVYKLCATFDSSLVILYMYMRSRIERIRDPCGVQLEQCYTHRNNAIVYS